MFHYTSCGSHLVAAVLVEHDQEDGHDHDDADHDDGVEDGVEEPASDRRGVLCERRVDPAETSTDVSCERRRPSGDGAGQWNLQLLVRLLSVEADRLDGGHHHHHAEGDGDEQHDDVLGSVLQSQLLLVCVHLLIRAAAVHVSRARPPAPPRLHQQRDTFKRSTTFPTVTIKDI